VNWPYIHTLVNHFPIILSVVGTAVLILALIVRHRGVFLYALATLTLAGLSVYPAFFTGDEAADAQRHTWYIVQSTIREHDAAAGFALWALLITGAVSAYAWWPMLKREPLVLPPVWLRAVVTVIAVWSLSVVVRTAYLGGKIVHDSPRLATPPAGFIAPDSTR
jgi:hypothetical protein